MRAPLPENSDDESDVSDSEDYEINEPEYHHQKPRIFETNTVFGHGMSEPCSLNLL